MELEDANSAYARVVLRGENDIASKQELRAKLEAAVPFELALIDMRDVTYIDSTALTEFIRLKRLMPGSAIVRIFGASQHIQKLFHVTGLDTQFEIHDSLESACRTTPPPPAQAWGNARSSRGTKVVRSRVHAPDHKLRTV